MESSSRQTRDWPYWRNLLLFSLVTLTIGAAIGGIYLVRLWTLANIHPKRLSISQIGTPADYGVPYQDVTLITSDGVELSAWYTPPQNEAVILVAHGHAGIRFLDRHVLFAQHGYGVVSWDFRAHGESGGDMVTFGYYEANDVEAALDYALSQPGVKRVGAWGGSMGGAATILAAARRPELEAVVVDSTYPTLIDMMDLKAKVAILRPVIRFFGERESGLRMQDIRPVEQIGLISPRPVMIIHGLADGAVPADSGQRLYEAAKEPKVLWSEAGVGHLEMYYLKQAEYERRVIEFFDTALLSGED